MIRSVANISAVHLVPPTVVGVLVSLGLVVVFLSGCGPNGDLVSGELTYAKDLRICRSIVRVQNGAVRPDDRATFAPARREAQRRGLDFDDCVAMLKKHGELDSVDVGHVDADRQGKKTSDVGAGDGKPLPRASAELRRQLFGHWEGVSEDVRGHFSSDSDVSKGNIQVEIEKPDMRCRGTWLWSRGKYGSPTPPQGTWAVACDNGRTASGTYTSYVHGEGIVEGTDDAGRKIIMYFK